MQTFLKHGADSLAKGSLSFSLIFGLFIYAICGALLLLALRGGEVSVLTPIFSTNFVWVALVAVFILVIILLQSARQIDYPFLDFLNNPNTQAVVIVILVFVLIIWYINKKPSEPTKPEDYFKKFKDTMKKMFEGQ